MPRATAAEGISPRTMESGSSTPSSAHQASTLLSQQATHRSALVLKARTEEELPPNLIVKTRMDNPIKLSDRIIQELSLAGLDSLALMPRIQIDASLITALVERWRPETHTFHLPVGEMTVTLEDVMRIMGLRVDGQPVTCPSITLSNEDLVSRYLGKSLTDQAYARDNKNTVKLGWLGQQFNELPDNDNELVIGYHTRAWLLFEFGSTLFPTLDNNVVSLSYIGLISDLRAAYSFSWGSAVLACLYRNLCRASFDKTKQIAGPLLMLQLWSWERLPVGRPYLVGADHSLCSGRPLGYYWECGQRDWKTKGPRRCTLIYRDDLDHLSDDQIIWEPYRDRLPGVKLHRFSVGTQDDVDRFLHKGPLINHLHVEVYCPHRVMRQFGLYQDIPPELVDTSDLAHNQIKLRCGSKGRFRKFYYDSYCEWCDRTRMYLVFKVYDYSTNAAYMSWLSTVSILRLCRHPLVQPVDPHSSFQPKTTIAGLTANHLLHLLGSGTDYLAGRLDGKELISIMLSKVRTILLEGGQVALATALPARLTPDWRQPELQHDFEPQRQHNSLPTQVLVLEQEPEPHTQSKHEQHPQPEPHPEHEQEQQPQPEPEQQLQPEQKPQPHPEHEQEQQPQPEPEQQLQPEQKPQPHPEHEQEQKPQPEPEQKPQPEPEQQLQPEHEQEHRLQHPKRIRKKPRIQTSS